MVAVFMILLAAATRSPWRPLLEQQRGPSRYARPHSRRPHTRRGCECHGTWIAHAIPRGQGPACAATTGIRGSDCRRAVDVPAQRQFALHCAGARAGQADQLRGIEAAPRLTKDQTQHALLRTGKQGIGQAGLARRWRRLAESRKVYTHIGHDDTQFGHVIGRGLAIYPRAGCAKRRNSSMDL